MPECGDSAAGAVTLSATRADCQCLRDDFRMASKRKRLRLLDATNIDARTPQGREHGIGDICRKDDADRADIRDLRERRAAELGFVEQEHRLARASDHRALDLSL